ncbi:AAA family ATPase [Vulcanisaeta sp. JCM 14467]|uniref:AAA family ATPase n=1 Tax=Vulcanisaeta sp. JCM 14467 TaxID=1295370 RepID=UPI0006D00888|nr:ATP-binding protein [Vulcanisaeta sp. JCM 14467]
MLFDVKPKVRKADLFDFDEEFNRLFRLITNSLTRLIIVRGLRRTGKTSLILTVLNELGVPYVFIDVREVVRSRRGLYEVLSRALSDFLRRYSLRRALIDSVVKALSSVRGVGIHGFEVVLNWGRDRPLLSELFREFDRVSGDVGVRLVIVIDEAQRLSGPVGVEVWNAVAHAYDFLNNLLFILSGSEMGVLGSILSNPESPLFGRAYAEVTTRKLNRDESLEFLRRGFSEVGIEVDEGELEGVVDGLDGVIGWLTYYGYSRSVGGRDLDSIISDAVGMARQELENFIRLRASRRYRVVLRLLALDVREWGLLKRRLEDYEGSRISDRVLHDILTTLKRHSIIDENLEFTDPVIRETAREL